MREPVILYRGLTSLETVSASFDPNAFQLFLTSPTLAQAGDTAAFRGYVRRITELPQVWLGGGTVLQLEAAPLYLPDLGQLLRPTGETTLDEVTGAIVPVNPTPIWSGLCSAEPQQSSGQNPDVGLQRLGIVPFLITVPLELVDVKPGDLFKVTQSRDARLVARTMTVTGVRASSTALLREVLAFDSQD